MSRLKFKSQARVLSHAWQEEERINSERREEEKANALLSWNDIGDAIQAEKSKPRDGYVDPADPLAGGFTISETFKKHFRELTQAEFFLLEESILKHERALDPLIIWDEQNILIDGHRRFHICEAYFLPYKIERLSFASEEEALDFVTAIQCGRRNLTEQEYKYRIGKLYNELKRQGRRTDLELSAGACQKSVRDKVIENLTKEIRSEVEERGAPSERTMRNYAAFASALDAMPEDEKSSILSGMDNTPVTRIVKTHSQKRKMKKAMKQKRAESKKHNRRLIQDIDESVIKYSSQNLYWENLQQRHQQKSYPYDILIRRNGVVYLDRGLYRIENKYLEAEGPKHNTASRGIDPSCENSAKKNGSAPEAQNELNDEVVESCTAAILRLKKSDYSEISKSVLKRTPGASEQEIQAALDHLLSIEAIGKSNEGEYSRKNIKI